MRSKLNLVTCYLTATILIGGGCEADAAPLVDGEKIKGIRGTVTAGVTWRDSERNPDVLNLYNAPVVGATGTRSGGRNADDGNLNFSKGNPVSSVVKVFVEGKMQTDDLWWVISAKGWYDATLERDAMPWGHIPNSYVAGARLSDAGADLRAKFSGVSLQSLYVEKAMRLDDLSITGRAGRQPIAWSEPSMIQGPLRNIDTQDTVAANRPGAVADETSIPAPVIRMRADWSSGFSLDGFIQLAHEPSPAPVCGTFFSSSDYGSGHCNKALSGNATDPILASREQNFMARSSVDTPPDTGQFGASMRFAPPDGRWHVQGFFANVHSRTAYLGVHKTGRSGDTAASGPLLAANPNGLNATYLLNYPANIQWFALVGSAEVAGGRLSLEYACSPNQPVALNIADLLTAFGTPATTPSILRASERAVPSGGVFNGWDRLSVEDLKVGYAHVVRNPVFADEISVLLEGVVKSVRDLPDNTIRRYRRPDVYGSGPYAGGPTCAGSAEQCTTAGYVSANATAVRLRVATKHTVFSDWQLTPSVTLGKDVQGWSYDNVLSEGRTSLVASLRVARRTWYLDWSINHRWGAPYGNLDDRDTMSLALGANF